MCFQNNGLSPLGLYKPTNRQKNDLPIKFYVAKFKTGREIYVNATTIRVALLRVVREFTGSQDLRNYNFVTFRGLISEFTQYRVYAVNDRINNVAKTSISLDFIFPKRKPVCHVLST